MDLQKGGALAPLSRLILEHFTSQLEVALRSAFEEVVGSSLPAAFIIDFGTAQRTAPKKIHDLSPRSPRRGPPRCPARDQSTRAQQPGSQGGLSNADSTSRPKAQAHRR